VLQQVVPRQCGAAGRRRPAPSAGPGEGAGDGPSRGGIGPTVPVRTLPGAGAAVQPLRPGPALLLAGVFGPVAASGTTRGGRPIPAQPGWAARPCCAFAALAPATAKPERDAPGFPAGGGRCSTADMEHDPCVAESSADRGADRPTPATTRLDVPTLPGSAVVLGAPELAAPCAPTWSPS
jgi:hypothetical protein